MKALIFSIVFSIFIATTAHAGLYNNELLKLQVEKPVVVTLSPSDTEIRLRLMEKCMERSNFAYCAGADSLATLQKMVIFVKTGH